MAIRKFAVDFMTVTIPADQPSMLDLLKEVRSRRPDERAVNFGDYVIILSDSHVSGNIFEGDLLKVRMKDLPVKATITGQLSDLRFASDEGVGEQVAFLYDHDTVSLVMQRNRNAATPSKLLEYIESLLQLKFSLAVFPVLEADAFERMNQIKHAKTFAISVAPQNPKALKRGGRGVAEVADLLMELGAPEIHITAKVGRRRKENLNSVGVFEMARRLFSFSSGQDDDRPEVQQIWISGKNHFDQQLAVDLIEDRIVETAVAEVSGRTRTLPYPQRRRALREAFERRRPELIKRFGRRK